MPPLPTRTSYDEFPYPSYPLHQTHPGHLATIATLLGTRPPPPERCRVLELGCAGGGNLIPLALTLPGSTFVGIDLSAAQVAEGQRTAAALGLTNVELRHLSILDVDDAFGEFDYVLCHGVYSWVPLEVQKKILAICARHLTARGIGFISYNTYPGWHLRGMIRDMLFYHASRVPGEAPAQRVARARGLLDFLTRAVPAGNTAYGLLLREQSELLRQHSDSYLFHEHLEEHNEPLYFLQFCERLAAHGLRYLGEAELHTMVAGTSFAPGVQQELAELAPSLLEQEQYMDFLRSRTFRQTLVCHDGVQPNYDVRAEQLAAFAVASPVQAKSPEPDLRAESPEAFVTPEGLNLTTSVPVVKAALACLGEAWPEPVRFGDLLSRARSRLGLAGGETAREDALALGRALLTAYASAGEPLVELSLQPPCFITRVSERPTASPLARLQAAGGNQVTSLRHRLVALTPFDRHLLPLLDGTRDRPALLRGLLDLFRRGDLRIAQEEQPLSDLERAAAILDEVLGQQLPRLARAALLLA
jgi:methyltransferase-like protein/SAM-dependent methyltransferase